LSISQSNKIKIRSPIQQRTKDVGRERKAAGRWEQGQQNGNQSYKETMENCRSK